MFAGQTPDGVEVDSNDLILSEIPDSEDAVLNSNPLLTHVHDVSIEKHLDAVSERLDHATHENSDIHTVDDGKPLEHAIHENSHTHTIDDGKPDNVA